jgi:hypothetical protein
MDIATTVLIRISSLSIFTVISITRFSTIAIRGILILIMGITPWEKGSCLWKLRKTQIEEESLCSICKQMEGRSTGYFKYNRIPYRGVCLALHSQEQENRNPNQEEGIEENTRPRRNAASVDYYKAEPSNGPQQMMKNRRDSLKNKLTLRQERRKAVNNAKQYKELLKKERGRRKSFAIYFGDDPNLSIPKNGASKAAKSRERKTFGNVAVGAVKQIVSPSLSKAQRIEKFEVAMAATTKKWLQEITMLRNSLTPRSEAKIQNERSLHSGRKLQLSPIPEDNSTPCLTETPGQHEPQERVQNDPAQDPFFSPISSPDSPLLPSRGGTIVAKRRRNDVPSSPGLLPDLVSNGVCSWPSPPREASQATKSNHPSSISSPDSPLPSRHGTIVAKRKRNDVPSSPGLPDLVSNGVPSRPSPPKEAFRATKSNHPSSFFDETAVGSNISQSASPRTMFKKARKEVRREQKKQKRVQAVKNRLGLLLDHIKTLDKPAARRPYLAALVKGNHTKESVAGATDLKLTSTEWSNIKIHALWPGPMKPVEQPEIFRCRVPQAALMALLRHIDSPGVSQKYAFGNKVLALGNGRETLELDNVSLRAKVDDVVADYLGQIFLEIDQHLDSYQTLPDDHRRCKKKDKGKNPRRCMNEMAHDGKCQFTPKGSISYTTSLALAKELTGPEIRKLAGLDDVKVLKGRDNWIRTKGIVDEVFQGVEAEEYRDRIDNQETFYSTDYIPHLSKASDHKCNCLTCGFCDKGKLSEKSLAQYHSQVSQLTEASFYSLLFLPSSRQHHRYRVPSSRPPWPQLYTMR